MKILLIEDDTRLLALEKQVLEEENHTVDTAADGDTGLELALRGTYDVAVIDWMLPGRDGPAICRAVRAAHLPTALLLLTARTQVEDRVAGLDSGADDYLSKPFSFDELLARVRALSRRFTIPSGDSFELRAGDLVMDLRAHTARRIRFPARALRHGMEAARIPDAPSGPVAHPAAGFGLRLVLRMRDPAVDGRRVHLLSARQTPPAGRARSDRDRARCRLPAEGVMFRFLRLRLTLLYLLGALLLVAAVGAAVYVLLQERYRTSIDLALEHRAALALHEVGEALPAALAQGELEWYAERGGNPPAATPYETEKEDAGENDNEETEASATPIVSPAGLWHAGEVEFDAELSPISLTAVRTDGGTDSITGGKNIFFDPSAIDPAVLHGIDFRTAVDSSGQRIRLLSLRLTGVPGYTALQVGRSLEDQDRILADLVKGLLEWGVVFALIMAAVSWWLSGRALRSAQIAWDKQQAFIAHAGHELRTPLTMIRAAAEITQRKLPDGDSRRGPVGAIIAEADRMGGLVGDLLLLSRLDARALRVDLRPVDLAPLLGELSVSFGRVAGERGVTLNAGPVHGKIQADDGRLRQVLLILLDNALRHAPEGSAIEIESSAAGRKVLLLVRDHGAGIPPEDLPHLFDRFYRGRGEKPESGSGLGLAIARELVEAMHGKIRIASGPGIGTTVTVELNAAE